VNASLLGNALPAWLPPSALSFKKRAKPDPAARGRRAVGGWLRQLGGVGAKLVAEMRELARLRGAGGGQTEAAPVDINLGWVLVRRATRWMVALRVRLAAENAAARLKIEPPAPMFEAAEADAKPAGRRRRPAGRPRPAKPPVEILDGRCDNCIDGIPTAAVMAQVCADLGAASIVLIEPDARRLVEAIAAEARALLGESDVALLPAPRVMGRWYGAPPAQAAMAGVPPSPPAPGTG
jgi:hypothetical protein